MDSLTVTSQQSQGGVILHCAGEQSEAQRGDVCQLLKLMESTSGSGSEDPSFCPGFAISQL